MTGKKIKIALCISGEPRNTMFTYSYIYESILRYRAMYDIDVYVHTFKNYRALNLYSPKSSIIDSTPEDNVFNRFRDSLSDLNLVLGFEKNLPVKNYILMNYGIQRCYESTQNEEYDYYIRLRPDLIFNDPFPLSNKIHFLENSDYDILLPHCYPHPDWKNQANDQFAIVKSKSANVYFNLLSNIITLIDQTQGYNPEVLLRQHLNNNNIKTFDDYTNISLVRSINPYVFPQNYAFISQ